MGAQALAFVLRGMESKEWEDPLKTVSSASRGPWLPLESNPDLLNEVSRNWGLPPEYSFVDVLGFDPPELLCPVEGTIVAAILLFPCTRRIYSFRTEQAQQLRSTGADRLGLEAGAFFLKQHREFGNACGTIAAVHAMVNGCGVSGLDTASALGGFASVNVGKPATDIGEALLACSPLKSGSDEAARSDVAQTRCPGRDAEPLDHHFAAFARSRDGSTLLELDGTKPWPICHGPTSSETFLADVAAVCRKCFIAVEPDSIEFNLMAMVRL